MALTQRMELRQGQSLVMTPQLQQAIKLLQMSNLELQAYVEGELERNPLLERDEATEAEKSEPRPEPQGERSDEHRHDAHADGREGGHPSARSRATGHDERTGQ